MQTTVIFLIFNILLAIINFAMGFYMKKKPPKKINAFYGYRTSQSKKSQKHWDYAQKEAADFFEKSALFYFVISVFGFAFDDTQLDISMLILFAIIICWCVVFISTIEKKLSRI